MNLYANLFLGQAPPTPESRHGIVINLTSSPSITDWILAVTAIFGVLSTFIGIYFLSTTYKSERKRRRLPPAGLTLQLQKLDSDLNDLINSPKESLWFLEEERRGNIESVRRLRDEVKDEEIFQAVSSALESYNKAFAVSPGKGQLDLPESQPRILEQSEAAHNSRISVQRALSRITDIRVELGDIQTLG